MARKKITTSQDFDDLYVDLMGGDSRAESEYRDEARKLAKRVNQQMRELERAGAELEAYNRAQDFLGEKTRFKENYKNMDIEEVQAVVDEMLAFYNAKYYSLPHARESVEQIDRLREVFNDIPGVDLSDDAVAFQMNEMFKTGAWQEYKKAHGKSTNLVTVAAEAFEHGKTVDDLLAAYNEYKEGGDNAPDIVQSWQKFAPWRS